MNKIIKRIAELSPEKRRLLEQLLQKNNLPSLSPESMLQERQISSANSTGEKDNVHDCSDERELLIDCYCSFSNSRYSAKEIRENKRKFYDLVSQQIDSTVFSQYALFLNYGFIPDDTPQYARVELPNYTINKNSIKLVLEVVGDCDITGRRILDIGCGRGGSIDVMTKYFHPKEIIGIDLSSSAIAFCRSNYNYSHANFFEGDAEKLTFKDDELDIVLNIESSHNYPDIFKFYREVYRVLKIGGFFLYADFFSIQRMDSCLSYLQEIGFSLEKQRDITNNVLLSCDETALQRLEAFRKENDPQIMGNFLGVPGSQAYDDMKNQKITYKIFKFKK
jgi:SAM-dependent methyltransferase